MIKTKAAILLVIGSFFVLGSANGAAVYVNDNQGSKYIVIEGEIIRGDYEKFINSALQAGTNIHSVYIASIGGDAIEAIRIGELIRDLKFATSVPRYWPEDNGKASCLNVKPKSQSNCTCQSSCVLIFLGGVYRTGEYLGIHRTFVTHDVLKKMSMNEAATYTKKISATLSKYFDKMGVPPSLLERMESIPSDQIEILDIEYITRHLNGYSKEYQEWVNASCGESSELHYLRRTEKDKDKLKKIHYELEKIVRCENWLLEDERGKSFYRAIEKAILNVDRLLVPKQSLLESVYEKVPFDIPNMIGMEVMEALDMLTLVGIPNHLGGRKNYVYENIVRGEKVLWHTKLWKDRAIQIDVNSEGIVSSITIKNAYQRHILGNLNLGSKAADFKEILTVFEDYWCTDILFSCYLKFADERFDTTVVFNLKGKKDWYDITFYPPGYQIEYQKHLQEMSEKYSN